jgi:hypothetical protein
MQDRKGILIVKKVYRCFTVNRYIIPSSALSLSSPSPLELYSFSSKKSYVHVHILLYTGIYTLKPSHRLENAAQTLALRYDQQTPMKGSR